MNKTKDKNYITPEGYKKLSKEYEQLLRVERPKITETVTWAASNGDRSENADYIYGKRRLREIDRRLKFLRDRLEAAFIVERKANELPASVQFGATVTVEKESESECESESDCKKYTIVGVDEIDLKKNLISWKSPLARALIGKNPGDEIEFQTPQGLMELKIIHIEYKIEYIQ